MNLLAIPNDATSAYYENSEEDFLSEFNPLTSEGERFFQNVYFLNWKDSKDEEYARIKSLAILKDKKPASELVKMLGINEIPFTYPLFTDIFLQEKQAIISRAKEKNIKIIRAFNADFATELGLIVKEELKIPLVTSVHNVPRITSAIKKADSLVCISEVLKKKCVEDYCVDGSKTIIIPDGIDMELFRHKKTSEISRVIDEQYNSDYKILSVGRINPQKNIEKILESVQIVKSRIKEVKHLHLGIGTRSDMEDVKKFKNRLGLKKSSYFLGARPKQELPSFYSWASVFLFPSLYEGLGRASIEALACGTPVVTTNYAPMTEVVQNDYNGLTINPHNPEDIAEALVRILKDSQLKKRLKENTRKSVEIKYNVKRIMQMHCQNYERVLKKS